MKRLAAASLQTLAAQSAGLVCGLVSGVVIARLLGPAAKGAIVVYMLIAGGLALAGNLGLGMANVHLVAKGVVEPRRAWANSLAASVVMGTVLAAGVFFAAPMVGIVVRRPLDMGLLLIALVSVPLLVLFDLQLNLMQGMGDIRGSNRAGLARHGLRLAALLLLVVILPGATAGALWAANIGLAGANLWCAFLLGRNKAVSPVPAWADLRRSLGYGLKTLPGQLIQFLSYRLDILLLAYFWTNREVGVYSVAVFVSELVWYVPQAVITVLLPRVSAIPDRDGLALTTRAIRHTVLWSVVCAVALSLAAPIVIVRLYGGPFAEAVPALWILLIGITALAPGKLAVIHLAGTGKPQYYSYLALAGFGLSVVLDLALIPRFGITGAAAASAAVYGLSGALALYWLRTRTGADLRQSLIVQRGDWLHYARLVPEFLRDPL